MSSTQSPFEDPSHGAPPTGIRGIFRALSVRQQEKSQEKKAARHRQQNWTLPDSGDCKSWSLEEIQQEYEILLKKYKDTTRDQNYLVNASITNKKEITHAGNVANQCREWVHDCKKTLQSLDESLRLVINKKEAQAAIVKVCKHPEPGNVYMAMKQISDADKRVTSLQTQIRGYVDALRQWLDKEPGF
ncbi:hypothetical protein H9Q72_005418 [Fusarium xylarioides]|uniref:Uncharacterized protein n=1 Tax=Fusarium xylarioides TaxID=221167 RepID=A0A9P7LHB6_9HYPO|nr:hypothetical protein H9Q70_004118 [Fusarium xylarioides]KAG5766552.1 hypothetical protein H9Q72_005418 [Fusarium xylarioides]KAG5781713.1 hypothetical protein H9Q73_004662 [Fusarium xylarioides]KAG5814056.1 hypothetical protein H9Q71_003425 [Fusarium xylarioides]KAG5828958.1 hypothetical protein H9Q74_000952 [Fusarium xylarioides]